MKSDTIAAIATALNNSGISIIRVSGIESIDIVDKIFVAKKKDKKLKDVKSHTLHYGYIKENDIIVDEVLVSVMKAPNSYTMEDVVEINCHGGIVVTKKILDIVIRNGARIAEPGEFTKRAFLNGRMDLSQAEAVIDVINSKNEYALASSIMQLKGNVLEEVKEIRENIIGDIALIESALDDPEHIDIDEYNDAINENVDTNIDKLDKLYKSSENGRIIKEGINTVIVGKPNAGKSSFLNLLVGSDRAIVTDVAGTTRDILEEEININGITLNVIDTAGIRQTDDLVEKIGVDKSKEYINKADLIIYIVDGSTKLDENDYDIIDRIVDKKVIILLNKTDLDIVTSKDVIQEKIDKDIIEISAKEDYGLDKFEKKIKDMFYTGKIDYNDEIYITNLRHKEAIKDSYDALLRVKESIQNAMPQDFYSIDMMDAYETLGKITGEAVDDDLVNTIFSKFCMGK